ncbi:MAG: hypothetical protein RLZZ437_1658 [Pseudomonadota bacterium]|jgi:hypothetical protein
MKQLAFLLAVFGLAGCNGGPELGLGINVGPGGVNVSPSVSGNVGGVNVGISGPGADL